MGICDQRSVIITGAGGGLGRAYALAFAAEGAKVCVNDIQSEAAEAVVAAIHEQGGEAIAVVDDITSMAGAERIVAAAVEAFGDVQVLVNNAGVLRDKMFVNLDENDWDLVMQVHLKGHFCLANALARRWREQAKAGRKVEARIINTSSGAGLQGSIAQSNYSAAKGGVASLTLVQAAELGRYGVTANALAPAARTAMTETAMPDVVKAPEDGGFDAWAPENVAPLVVWLGSTASEGVTGQIFESQGGRLSVCDGWRTGPEEDREKRLAPQEAGETVRRLMDAAEPAQKVWGT